MCIRDRLAYSFDIAFQNEFSREENIALARQFLLENFVSRGMVVEFAAVYYTHLASLARSSATSTLSNSIQISFSFGVSSWLWSNKSLEHPFEEDPGFKICQIVVVNNHLN